MRKSIAFAAAAAILAAAGCATVSVPWYEAVKSYPVIGLGDPKPADGRYVVLLPAGKPVPMRILIEGSIFEEKPAQEVYAVPNRDIYLYENSVSFDLETWKRRGALLEFGWDVGIPSFDNPVPGHLKITVNERAGQ